MSADRSPEQIAHELEYWAGDVECDEPIPSLTSSLRQAAILLRRLASAPPSESQGGWTVYSDPLPAYALPLEPADRQPVVLPTCQTCKHWDCWSAGGALCGETLGECRKGVRECPSERMTNRADFGCTLHEARYEDRT